MQLTTQQKQEVRSNVRERLLEENGKEPTEKEIDAALTEVGELALYQLLADIDRVVTTMRDAGIPQEKILSRIENAYYLARHDQESRRR